MTWSVVVRSRKGLRCIALQHQPPELQTSFTAVSPWREELLLAWRNVRASNGCSTCWRPTCWCWVPVPAATAEFASSASATATAFYVRGAVSDGHGSLPSCRARAAVRWSSTLWRWGRCSSTFVLRYYSCSCGSRTTVAAWPALQLLSRGDALPTGTSWRLSVWPTARISTNGRAPVGSAFPHCSASCGPRCLGALRPGCGWLLASCRSCANCCSPLCLPALPALPALPSCPFHWSSAA